MNDLKGLPEEQLPYSKKGTEWRKKHLDWADDRSYFNSNRVRQSIMNKQINYDLINGKIHMDDFAIILNPTNLSDHFIPDVIQHYPVINSKLNVLRGEEIGRRFDFKVICTNPNAISSIEEDKHKELVAKMQSIIQTEGISEDEMQQKMQELEKEFKYKWQDIREIRANALLNHYIKEYNINSMFSDGFMDAMIVGEEVYRCDIVGGEPTIEKINPLKLRVYRSGYSNKIEDADIIVYEDYWPLGRIIDTYHDSLTPKDYKYLEKLPFTGDEAENGDYDDTKGFVNATDIFANHSGVIVDNFLLFTDAGKTEVYDSDGNIRVLQVYWKSRRKIKKVKSYNETTGEEEYNFYTEDYVIDEAKGEEEEVFWINEAWEGTKIGKEIYINMRPRQIQYNRLSNPSRCHFGFVGSFYNVNEDHVFSLVDSLKPFAYLYDVIHDRLNKAIEANWGQIFELDLASVPKGWDVEKWIWYAKTNHLAVKDSFNEGNIGAAKGKLAGGFAANSRGIIGNDTGNYIQEHINLLEYIKNEMSDAVGITKQREGNIANRETVGGVERSTLQSSYITEWLFNTHKDVKKRALECFLETAKIAMRGKSKKFQYCLSDLTLALVDIDGDEFSENDYGLVVDDSPYTQNLSQNLNMLAQAALQNQLLSFSSIMKIYTSSSLSETQRMIEEEEAAMKQQQQQMQEQQMQMQQQQLEAQQQMKENELAIQQAKIEVERENNIRDNETRIQVAAIQAQTKAAEMESDYYFKADPAELKERGREFDEKLKLEEKKLNEQKEQNNIDEAFKKKEFELKKEELQIKRTQANKRKTTLK